MMALDTERTSNLYFGDMGNLGKGIGKSFHLAVFGKLGESSPLKMAITKVLHLHNLYKESKQYLVKQLMQFKMYHDSNMLSKAMLCMNNWASQFISYHNCRITALHECISLEPLTLKRCIPKNEKHSKMEWLSFFKIYSLQYLINV